MTSGSPEKRDKQGQSWNGWVNKSSRRVQFVALRPKVVRVWFFDPILRELAGSTLGLDDNTLAVTALDASAEFQDEAGRARWRGMPWLSRRRLQKNTLIGQLMYGHDPLRRKGSNSVDLDDRICFR